ncbi:transcriptional activator leucine zipper [Micractinium conductrix]|uniref:Transcriptional activator leucine zipper n=1 Tax=Micractinium conductrix TaxID=554055 RepID=A0A2P6VIX7_9CHLO|nr:transcriptional activator leucine zipper [Micractinium conductrix]|eukprot:PSC74039.1 transcriptional activator leucine zipper [Micractinium conductrix]
MQNHLAWQVDPMQLWQQAQFAAATAARAQAQAREGSRDGPAWWRCSCWPLLPLRGPLQLPMRPGTAGAGPSAPARTAQLLSSTQQRARQPGGCSGP